MRIALTVEDFRAWRGGGEGYAVSLARALAARGHEIHVFAAQVAETPNGIVPHRVPVSGGFFSKRAAFARNCARLIEKEAEAFDVVHGLGKSVAMDVFRPGGGVHRAWRRQDPLSIESPLRRSWVRFRRCLSIDQWLVLKLEAEQFRSGPDGPEIIANSQMVRRHILEHYPVPEDRIHIIYNGVDTERFSPENRKKYRAAMRKKFGAADSDTVLLFMANNFRLKGLGLLVRALGMLRDVRDTLRVVVVGRGRAWRYRNLAGRLGMEDRIAFVGQMNEPEKAYAGADMLVHPTFYDPCANVTLEAMASGLPVVTSIYNGAGELIEPGVQGEVIDPSDPAALAGAIRTLLTPDHLEAAGIAARQLAEKHTLAGHIDEVLGVYKKILAQSR